MRMICDVENDLRRAPPTPVIDRVLLPVLPTLGILRNHVKAAAMVTVGKAQTGRHCRQYNRNGLKADSQLSMQAFPESL